MLRRFASCLVLLGAPIVACAQVSEGEQKFQAMLHALPAATHSAAVLSDFDPACDERDGRRGEEPGITLMQYIFNGMYEWTDYSFNGKRCIRLNQPVNRFLTAKEGLALVRASDSEYPVPTEPLDGNSPLPPVPGDLEPAEGNEFFLRDS